MANFRGRQVVNFVCWQRFNPLDVGDEVEVSVVADDFGDAFVLHVGDRQSVFEVKATVFGIDVEGIYVDMFLGQSEAAYRDYRC